MAPPKRTKRVRSHTMGGCATCRRRHVKCDLVKPHCLTCQAVGLPCEGYSNGLRWVSSGLEERQAAHGTGMVPDETTRRHLFTEQSMASMSTALTQGLVSQSVDVSLSDIDTKGKDLSTHETQDIAVGPFRILNFNKPFTSVLPVEVPSSSNESAQDARHLQDISPLTVESFDNFNDLLDWSDIFALDLPDQYAMTFPQPTQSIPSYAQLDSSDSTIYAPDAFKATADERMLTIAPSSTLNAPRPTDLHSPTVQLLLKHYRSHVVASMSSLPMDKHSPWKVLNVTAAVQTLAEATYLDGTDIKHANLANLCVLLATSALDLARHPQDVQYTASYWQAYSESASKEAKHHLQKSLRTEFQGENKAKYKDQLMAILALIVYAVQANNQIEARTYMIDAERLLRIRGLAKRVISRKARLLHHVYTWFRIVGESTYVLHDFGNHRMSLTKISDPPTIRVPRDATFSQSRSGQNARLDDFLRLEASDSDENQDLETPKVVEVGLYDIHLEDPREDPGSLNVHIHGVPELWLTLVSHTTRLANVIDSISYHQGKEDGDLSGSLRKRSERLENKICEFAAQEIRIEHSSQRPALDGPGAASMHKPKYCFNRALNSALVIFFYRRIRNVNPLILQGHVDDVIQALYDYDEAMMGRAEVGRGTVWPAFMAACEALTSSRRQRIKTWIEKGIISANSASFQVALDTVQDLWRRRDVKTTSSKQLRNSSRTSTRLQKNRESTWMDIVREKGLWPMLF